MVVHTKWLVHTNMVSNDLALAKTNERISKLKREVQSNKISKLRFNPQKLAPIQQTFSKEQGMLRELFAGPRTFGTGQNLPQLNNALTSGGGLINNGDYNRNTGRMFGLR